MNEIKDPKYTWRTVFVNHNDMVMKKLKDYENGKQDGEWPSNPGRPRSRFGHNVRRPTQFVCPNRNVFVQIETKYT
jgi:hypothetical protein